MARSRFLSTDASLDIELNSLSLPALALYLLTIPHLDRDGLIDGHPLALVAKVAPLRADLSDAEPLIQEWVIAGLVERYPLERGRSAIHFPSFRKHQPRLLYDRESASRFPPPPGWQRTPDGMVPTDPVHCLRMAEVLDERTNYHRALLAAANGHAQPQDRAEIALNSRSQRDLSAICRAEIIHDVDVDHSPQPSPTFVCEKERGVGETNHHGTGGVALTLADYADPQLRTIANALGEQLGLQADWHGWRRTLERADRDTLLLLIGWEWFYCCNANVMDAIRSLPAVIRTNLKDRAPAYLRPGELDRLAVDAATIIMTETI